MNITPEEVDIDIDSLWEIANIEFENENKSKKKLTNKCKDNSITTCNHSKIYINNENFEVCEECGLVLSTSISSNVEWNNYKDDSGNYQKNTQRADINKNDNPYSTQTCSSSSIPWNYHTLIGKLHMQQNFTHKQKTYWLISKYIEHVSGLLNLSKNVIDDAKNYWHIYMESGKLTRASVRKGLICACLLYSCNKNSIPIEREKMFKIFECDSKALSKGEKILFNILNQSSHIDILTENSQYFNKYCSKLNLEWKIRTLCNDLFCKYKTQLQAVSPKSAVGGIITYIVKNQLKLKNPTKTEISATVDVCTPTLNKVINLLQNLENQNK